MSKYAEMGKEELRAACRKAGVSYGKLNNAGMREALEKKDAEALVSSVKTAIDEVPASLQPGAKKAIQVPLAKAVSEKPAKVARKRVPSDKDGYPRPGTQCRAVWDACDAEIGNTLLLPDVKWVKQLAADKNWNVNNTVIEYYQWRKVKGITGRADPKLMSLT